MYENAAVSIHSFIHCHCAYDPENTVAYLL